MQMKKQIGVIGGGAAGMMAAITAAKEGAQVTILERNDRVGKKILQTGNGKCNLGNRALSVECYHGGDLEWIRDVLEHFDTEDTIRFFQSIGLMVKEKTAISIPCVSRRLRCWTCCVMNYRHSVWRYSISARSQRSKNWPPESCRSVTEKRHGSSMRRL